MGLLAARAISTANLESQGRLMRNAMAQQCLNGTERKKQHPSQKWWNAD